MRKWHHRPLGVLALAGALAACDEYLEGPDLTTDPNRPSTASIDQLYQGMQVTQFVWHTGDLARTSSMFMQQMAGTDRQYIDWDLYNVTEADHSGYFSGIYTGGGLVDLRAIQAMASDRNDPVFQGEDRLYRGIARVWEGFLMGMAASVWGDLPYSEAVGENAKPALDDQAEVYAAVQRVLSEAIADLESGAGVGPGSRDLVYGGDPAKWIRAAHTLKARFAVHWVEAQTAGGSSAALAAAACGGDCVQLALSEAQRGVSDPADDLRTFHSANPGEENLWYQFMQVFRPGYLSAGRTLVELLRAGGDARLTAYFAPVDGGEVVGAPPGASVTASQLGAARGAPGFRQPLVTFAENELIRAEAAYRSGDPAGALARLNAAREAAGVGALSGLGGEALLRAIATEKYVALFQNLEVWNDHKRLCVPALTPASGNALPGRLFYGVAERNANPNIPEPGRLTDRNDNDPNAC